MRWPHLSLKQDKRDASLPMGILSHPGTIKSASFSIMLFDMCKVWGPTYITSSFLAAPQSLEVDERLHNTQCSPRTVNHLAFLTDTHLSYFVGCTIL